MNGHDRSLPELPTLEPGIQLLETEGDSRGPLHALVADHLLLNGGRAYWVDANGHATSRPIGQLVPDRRLLERIRVARGFTAVQHHALVDAAVERVGDETSLLVLPALDGPYRSDDLRREYRKRLFVHSIATVAAVARAHELPVLVTRTRDNSVSEPLENAARDVLVCERTRFGPRFVADEFETLVYPTGDGWLQTTLSFWRRVLEARKPLYERASPETPAVPPEVTVDGAH